MSLPPDWVERLQDFAYYGALGGFSALVGYLYRTVKHKHIVFSWPVTFVSVLIGVYLGILVAGFIPASWEQQQRDSMVLLLGATGVKGFEFITEKFALDRLRDLLK